MEVDFQISWECLVGTFGHPNGKKVTLELYLTTYKEVISSRLKNYMENVEIEGNIL